MADRDYQNGERAPSRNEMETGRVTECVREREEGGRRRRARRKRILTGTAVIWRALCSTIVERRAEKRKTRDDVRFSRERSIRLYIMRRNKTRRAFSPYEARLGPPPPREICLRLLVPLSVRVPERRDSINTGYCGQPIVVTSEMFACDKLHTSAACVPTQFQRIFLRIYRISLVHCMYNKCWHIRLNNVGVTVTGTICVITNIRGSCEIRQT